MTQILSIIMVIAMAFSSFAGMTAGIEGTQSFEMKISLDSEAVTALAGAQGAEIPEETKQGIKIASDVLNALTLKGVTDRESAELALLAGESVVLTVGAKNEEGGVTVASSLLGEDAIFVSDQMIELMKQQMAQSASSGAAGAGMAVAQGIDTAQAVKDCEEAFAPLVQAIEAAKGETETGEFTVDDMAFTARTPVNMTYTEFIELFLTCEKDLLSRDSMKPLAQVNGQDMVAEVEKAIENIRKQPDDEKPTLEIAAYTAGDGSTYTVGSLAQESRTEGTQGEKIYAAFGTVEGEGKIRALVETGTQRIEFHAEGDAEKAFSVYLAAADGKTETEFTVIKDASGVVLLAAEYRTEEGSVQIAGVCELKEEDRTGFTVDVHYNASETPILTLTGSFGKSSEPVASFAGDLNVITVESLSDADNETAAGQLQMKMMAGLLKGVTVVTKNVPEDTAEWINAQIRQMMSPATPQGN